MTITVTGGVTFSPATVGGAVSFNGSTQYLTTPYISAFDVGTGDFTLECWYYPTTVSGVHGILSNHPSLTGGGFGMYISSTAITAQIFPTGTNNPDSVGGGTLAINTWNHLAMTRASGTLSLWINGVSTGTPVTSSKNPNNTTGFSIGAYEGTTYKAQGNITNVRFVVGTALYTSNFAPPTSPLTITQSASINGNPSAAITGTQTALLLNVLSSSAYLTDSSTNNFTVTPVSSPTFTSTSPITTNFLNGGAVSLNGSTQYLYIAANSILNITTGSSFTIEAFIYPTSSSSVQQLITQDDGTSTGQCFQFRLNTLAPEFIYFTGSGRTPTTITGNTAVTLNTWNHVAVSYDGTNVRLFLNGTVINTTATAAANFYSASVQTGIGAYSGGSFGNYFTGNMSIIRIVKGVAVYTSNFTPSTNPVTTTQSANINGNPSAAITGTQTSLLLNVLSSSAYLTDGSTNNLTVTPVGSPTFTSTSPFGTTGYITFSPGPYTGPYTVSYLVAAGGGGGGAAGTGGGAVNSTGGGGGAGGLLTSTALLTPGTVYTISVGAGGTTTSTSAANGTLSSISGSGLTTISSTGGGAGGIQHGGTATGATGGSGGGGAGGCTSTNAGGSAVAGQGNNGATSSGGLGNGGGGGGGGAGAVGTTNTSSVGGIGGAGSLTTILPTFVGTASTASSTTLTITAVTTGLITTGTQITGSNIPAGTYVVTQGTGTGGTGTYIMNNAATTTTTGVAITSTGQYVAGGGGTSIHVGTGGAGGAGGGGAGSVNGGGGAGAANTGGGGAAGINLTNAGGQGGSGIVILSIPTASYSGITTGSPTVITSGSFTYLAYTASSGSYTA